MLPPLARRPLAMEHLLTPAVKVAAQSVDSSVDPPPSSMTPSPTLDAPQSTPNDAPQSTPNDRLANYHFHFKFNNALTAAAGQAAADLVLAPLTNLSLSTCREDIEKAIHHPMLFTGFESEDAARRTIMARLTALASETRNHRELSDDPDFQLRRVMPVSFADAITAIATREGWHRECLYQELKCCTAFTENPATKLKERVSDLHARACNIPCLRAADASARKTSLDGYGTHLLTDGRDSPPEFHDRSFIAGDCTVRCIRNSSELRQVCCTLLAMRSYYPPMCAHFAARTVQTHVDYPLGDEDGVDFYFPLLDE